MEIDIQKIKDDTAKEHGFADWHNCLCETFQLGDYDEMLKVTEGVILKVHETTSYEQRVICAKKAKTGPYTRQGLIDFSQTVVDQKSILNCESPKIK